MKRTTAFLAAVALCMVSSAYAKPPATDIQSKEGEKLGTAKEEKPRSGEKVKGPQEAIVIKASEVLENLKKYDAIYESGFSVSGFGERRYIVRLDLMYCVDTKTRWKLTSSAGRFVYMADMIDREKLDYRQLGGEPPTTEIPSPGQADGQDEKAADARPAFIRTKRWGYWGSDAAGHFFEDKCFYVTPKNEATEVGRLPKVSLLGPRDTSSNPSKYTYLWALGRMFSTQLDKVTRAEESEDGLLIVSALGKRSASKLGRWELEIEPGAAWMVRKARFYWNRRPERPSLEMENSGTVWSGSYCIPKEAKINYFGPIGGGPTRHLTFDPVVGRFDEKLYSYVRQAVVNNKELTLQLHDYRVSPKTVTEPNKPKPEGAQR